MTEETDKAAYYRIENFRVTFILQNFNFRIILKILNSQASIRLTETGVFNISENFEFARQ